MTPDPCWLPSAIMQTTGALVGLYLIAYIYVSQTVLKYSDRRKESIYSHVKWMHRFAYLSLMSGCTTIGINLCWLWALIHYQNMSLPFLERLSILFFVFTLICVTFFSLQALGEIEDLK